MLRKWVLLALFIMGAIIVGVYLFGNSIMASPPKLSKLNSKDYANGKKRAADAAARVSGRLNEELKVLGAKVGDPVYIRVFKESMEMELWLSPKGGEYTLFKTYRIVAMSGDLGPKLKEGDRQAPEGFYYVNRGRMNPQSRFHLAFNVGYPNAYDRSHGRTGSALMVHGNSVSIGCFAMTDYYIEEIYTLCDAALNKGQPFFRVHSFPFRMNDQRMRAAQGSKWINFWQNLKIGYDQFERTKIPPNVNVSRKKYTFK